MLYIRVLLVMRVSVRYKIHMFLGVCALEPTHWHIPLLCASHPFLQSPEALEKNQKWLEYDQQREAYVRAILVRMLRLETQLNEANQAQSQQHNKDHSAGK